MSGQGWGGSPEFSASNNIDRGRDRREVLAPVFQKAHEKAVREVFTNPALSIQESDFVGVYGAETVAREIAEGARLEQRFRLNDVSEQQKVSHKIADVFEAILVTQGQQSEWLGSARTFRTARYDDYTNKVDMLAEWSLAGGHSHVLGLGVDVTLSTLNIDKKLVQIKQEIDRGELGEIRYFKDMQGNFSGTRHNVPRTIIGVGEPIIRDLAVAWLNGEAKALRENPVQLFLLNQIAFQLSHMRKYAESKGQAKVVVAYDQALFNIRRIRDNKASMKVTPTLQNDPIGRSLTERTKSVFAVAA